MNEFTKQLLIDFLNENFGQFQRFLDACDVDETEAEAIIVELEKSL